ncbi:MAG: imidazolonepropionase [Fimbriimonadaceae bacterium]
MLVTNIGQLVTLGGSPGPRRGAAMRELQIILDGAMLVRNGITVAVGRPSDFQSDDEEILDCGGRAVLPGFVDAHTHPVWGGDRLDEFELRAGGASYEEIAASGGGIQSSVRQTRLAPNDELKQKFDRHARWFLEGGTTTIEAKSGYGLDLETEIRLLQTLGSDVPLRVIRTVLAAHAFPSDIGRSEYVDLICTEILPTVTQQGLATNADIFVEEGYFSHADARRIMAVARGVGLGIRMHVDQLTNNGGAMLAAQLGADSADHLEQTDATGINALSKSGTFPILLPASVYALGKTKFPEARTMIDAGLPVVLATDFNPGSSPTPSIPMVMNLACTQMKMTPAEALTAVTINAAHSLKLGETVGSLEPTKCADFTIWDTDDYREIAYHFAVNLLWQTYVAGQRVT